MRYWIQTKTAKAFDLENPSPDCIDLETISYAMARIPRFSGHGQFYSLAQHSMHVHSILKRWMPNLSQIHLAGLLHDVHEVYDGFGDILNPAKMMMPDHIRSWYDRHVAKVNGAIASKFGLPVEYFDHKAVKDADKIALATEKRDVMGPNYPADWGLPSIPDSAALKPCSDWCDVVAVQSDLYQLLQYYGRLECRTSR